MNNAAIHADGSGPAAAICRALLIGIAFWFAVPAGAEQSAVPPLSNLAKDSAAKPSERVGRRTTVLVPLPAEPGWQDMAFLAAIPAATVINRGAPSLVVLEAAGTLTPEIQDYLRRYRPDEIVLLGNATDGLVIAGHTCGVLKAGDADEAACVLSKRFWRTSVTAVVCPEGYYEAGLVAVRWPRVCVCRCSLPARKVFRGWPPRKSPACDQGIDRGGRTRRRTAVIEASDGSGDRIRHRGDVMIWARNRKLTVAYVAALNPPRPEQDSRKEAVAGRSVPAAGRDGLVVPLLYDIRWKVPFHGAELHGKPPAGAPQSKGTPKTGRIVFGDHEYSFILTGSGKPIGRDLKINIDRDGDGTFTGAGGGPFVTGDTVELDGKRHPPRFAPRTAPATRTCG